MEKRTSVYIGQHGVDPNRGLVFKRGERMQAGGEGGSRSGAGKRASRDRRTSCGKSGAQHSTTWSAPPSPANTRDNTTNRDQEQPLQLHLFSPFIPWIARLRARSLFIMDVVAAVSGYISKMVTASDSASASSSAKMKILLLDSETVRLALTKHIIGHDRLITFYPGIHCLDCHHPVRPP